MNDSLHPHFVTSQRGDVLIVRFTVQELRGDDLTTAIRQELTELVQEQNVDKVVLDFQDVTFVSSRGMGNLAAFRVDFRRDHGGEVALCHLREMVKHSLSLIRFVQGARSIPLTALATPKEELEPGKPLFEHVTDDLDSAIAALQSPAHAQGE